MKTTVKQIKENLKRKLETVKTMHAHYEDLVIEEKITDENHWANKWIERCIIENQVYNELLREIEEKKD